jgi:hypothetical protein
MPEAIPGYRWRYKPGRKTEGRYWDLKGMLQHGPHASPFVRLGDYCMFIPLTFGPAWVYRWTLKSTWWVYLPFLWILQPARFRSDSVWDRLRWIRDDRLVVWYSVLVLTMVGVKIRLWQLEVTFAEWWNHSTVGQFFNAYIAPDSMPLWQYTAMANSILAITMFVVARNAIRSRDTTEPWPESHLDYALRWATICRRLLTCYSLIVVVLITVQQGIPPIGRVLPW